MNIEIINSLKERAKEMLKDNYDRKIGDEEIYTIICELENFYRAYEKEKVGRKVAQDNWGQNVRLVEELKAELEKEKELRLDRRRR